MTAYDRVQCAIGHEWTYFELIKYSQLDMKNNKDVYTNPLVLHYDHIRALMSSRLKPRSSVALYIIKHIDADFLSLHIHSA